jgi:MoxR-like ATPase
MNAAMAAALINGRNYTLPDDVQQMSGAVLSHRLVIDQQQFQSQYSPQSIIRDIIRSIKVPGVS